MGEKDKTCKSLSEKQNICLGKVISFEYSSATNLWPRRHAHENLKLLVYSSSGKWEGVEKLEAGFSFEFFPAFNGAFGKRESAISHWA